MMLMTERYGLNKLLEQEPRFILTQVQTTPAQGTLPFASNKVCHVATCKVQHMSPKIHLHMTDACMYIICNMYVTGQLR